MFITVTDEGIPPHEYAASCKCRGCAAVRRVKVKRTLIAFPAMIVGGGFLGFVGLGLPNAVLGVAMAILVPGILMWITPRKEVLRPRSNDGVSKL